MITSTIKKKRRLKLVLLAAAALGSSSATMSGVFAAFAVQHSVGGETTIA